MFTERSQPFCSKFLLAYFFSGINCPRVGEARYLVDFSDHFLFAG